jgi:hypothetical protein
VTDLDDVRQRTADTYCTQVLYVPYSRSALLRHARWYCVMGEGRIKSGHTYSGNHGGHALTCPHAALANEGSPTIEVFPSTTSFTIVR